MNVKFQNCIVNANIYVLPISKQSGDTVEDCFASVLSLSRAGLTGEALPPSTINLDYATIRKAKS